MIRIQQFLKHFYYSFAIQLCIVHLRNHLILLSCWLLIILMASGNVGKSFGVKYLFLAPEYLGDVGFPSHFFLGCSFGGFFMSWNLVTYTLTAHYFPFLASLERPFTKFCLNNALIPFVFLIMYVTYIIHFQLFYEYWSIKTVAINLVGFLLGVVFMLLMFSLYFEFTNKDIQSFKVYKKVKKFKAERNIMPGLRGITIETVKNRRYAWRVDNYISENLKTRLVRSVAHYESALLWRIFKQNHLNALVIQLVSMTTLIVMGSMIEQVYFKIPAGASFFIFMSLIISIVGALIYWLHQWKLLFALVFLIMINTITKYDFFKSYNKAYGLIYSHTKAEYSLTNLINLASPQNIEADKSATLSILNKWSARFKHYSKKPKVVLFNASGGGLKSGVWAMQVLQQADTHLKGKLMRHTVLMTGASGGMLGQAYYRELFLRKKNKELIDYNDSKYIDKLSKDLLNSVCFTIVSNDIFMPWTTFTLDTLRYRKDRGYIFEHQLHENTDFFLYKSIKEYNIPEKEAIIPLLFITPTILNDGRRLVISAQGVSYMMQAPLPSHSQHLIGIDAVDFNKLFEKQGSENLQFASALRMNAAYPYILPNVHLPSYPSIEIMDAGLRDNYGVSSSVRFLHVFADWVREHTSGVILVRAIGWDKNNYVEQSTNQGAVESALNPLGILGQLSLTQAYEQDNYLSLLETHIGKGKLHTIDFNYRPSRRNERASMSFHLTSREKFDIMNAFFLPENQKSLQQLEQLLK